MSEHRVAVIGVGSIGERHLRCFGQSGRAEVCFVEPNEALAATIAGRYPAARRVKSIEGAIADGVDAAVIATPAPLHIQMARQFVEADKAVLIEKPLAVTRNCVDELKAAVARHKTTVGVAYVYRAHPVLDEMRQAIASGQFGRPVQLVAVCGQNFPTYRPAYRDIYYARHESGGGAVQDALTHIINAGQWLVGPIQRLTADAAHQVLEGVTVEDTVHVLTRQGGQGQVMGSYNLNQHQAPNESTISVICAQGTVRFEYHNNRWRSQADPAAQWAEHPGIPLERDDLFVRQANLFMDAMEGKVPVRCTLEEADQTLKANIGILASVADGQWKVL
jgi:predicted dehydrogenase